MEDFEETINEIKIFLFKNNFDSFKLFIFGSRARKDFNAYSDYDLCLVLKDKLNFLNRIDLAKNLFNYLVQINKMLPIDLIIKSELEFDFESNYMGNICFYVKNEGYEL